ncbi:unnamed protein product [Blepharisma stoltei]|uniref:THH1/TOM1/TOM3 domain-containing protein n=1 Tax=Blepharisma stoltei TaxID=1481888 RepID=A0AAU9IFX0_9CILI|nr:unnamed protein product [Blepharisma stoltei]
MTELGVRPAVPTEGEEIGLHVILAGYLFLFGISIGKTYRSFKSLGDAGFVGLKLYYFIIIFILFLRILSLLRLDFAYSLFIYSIFDCLSCATLTLLGTTFCLLWVEMYISTSMVLTDQQKNLGNRLALLGYAIINFINYSTHIYVVVDSYFHVHALIYDTIWENLMIPNIIFSFITVIGLSMSGRYLSNHIIDVYPSSMGEKISLRIRFVSLLLCIAFFVKSIAPFALLLYYDGPFANSQVFWMILVIFYYGAIEISPICVVLFTLNNKTTSDEDDQESLPDGLLFNSDNSHDIFDSKVQLSEHLLNKGSTSYTA